MSRAKTRHVAVLSSSCSWMTSLVRNQISPGIETMTRLFGHRNCLLRCGPVRDVTLTEATLCFAFSCLHIIAPPPRRPKSMVLSVDGVRGVLSPGPARKKPRNQPGTCSLFGARAQFRVRIGDTGDRESGRRRRRRERHRRAHAGGMQWLHVTTTRAAPAAAAAPLRDVG